MASIQKRTNKDGSASYIRQIRRQGYPSITRAFGSKLEAEHFAAITEGKAVSRTLVVTANTTVAQLLDDVAPHLKSPYAAALGYWREEIGHVSLRNVTRQMIAHHRDRLLGAPTCSAGWKTTKPRGPTTVWMYLQQLHRAFELGRIEFGVIEANPVSDVRRPSLPRGRERFLGADERVRLLAACRESSVPSLYPFVLFLMTCGTRRGETYKLTWDRVDLDHGVATLSGDTTKTGRTRRVALVPAVREALDSLPRTSEEVFPGD